MYQPYIESTTILSDTTVLSDMDISPDRITPCLRMRAGLIYQYIL